MWPKRFELATFCSIRAKFFKQNICVKDPRDDDAWIDGTCLDILRIHDAAETFCPRTTTTPKTTTTADEYFYGYNFQMMMNNLQIQQFTLKFEKVRLKLVNSKLFEASLEEFARSGRNFMKIIFSTITKGDFLVQSAQENALGLKMLWTNKLFRRKHGTTDVLKSFIAKNADLNAFDCKGYTILHHEISFEKKNTNTAIFESAFYNHIECVKHFCFNQAWSINWSQNPIRTNTRTKKHSWIKKNW